MNRFFLLTLLSIFLFITTTYGEEATKVEHKTSTIPIREHAPSAENDQTNYENEDDSLAKLKLLWNTIFELNPSEADGNLFFELDSLWEDDTPVQYEASIRQYDPSNPLENSSNDDKQFLKALFESLLDNEKFDLANYKLDSESFSSLMNDWKEYIGYLFEEFNSELDTFKTRDEIDSFMFENINDVLKQDLTSNKINNLNEFVEKASQLDQELVLACLDDMALKLEEKILSNIDEEELMKTYIDLLDQFISEDITGENQTTKSTENEELLNAAVNEFESSKEYDINKLENYLQNNTNDAQFTNNNDIQARVYSCSDLNNKADLCEANEECMYVAKEGTNNEFGQCKLNPYYMEHLVNTGCKMESKGDLLSVARDLQSEGIFDNSVLNHLRTVQEIDELCRTITYTYFGDLIGKSDIPEASEFDATEWNTLSPQEKLNLILAASEEM